MICFWFSPMEIELPLLKQVIPTVLLELLPVLLPVLSEAKLLIGAVANRQKAIMVLIGEQSKEVARKIMVKFRRMRATKQLFYCLISTGSILYR